MSSFTMRAVAKRLGVRPAALYRVSGSREDLQFEALKAIANREHLVPGQVRSWQSFLRWFVDAQWQMLDEDPELAIVVNTRSDAFVAALPQLTLLMEELTRLGIPGGMETASFAVDFVGDTTFTTFMQMRGFRDSSEGRMQRERVMQAMGANPDVFNIANLDERGNLNAKVEFIIAGIEAGLFRAGRS